MYCFFVEFCASQSFPQQVLREDREPEEQREHEERVLMGDEPSEDRQDGRRDRQVEEEGPPGHQTVHVSSRLV